MHTSTRPSFLLDAPTRRTDPELQAAENNLSNNDI